MTVTVPADIAREIRLAAHAITWNIPVGDAIEPGLDEVAQAGYAGAAVFGYRERTR